MAKNNLVCEFTDDNFDAEIKKAEVPVLVDAWASWCGPCKAMNPIIADIAASYAEDLKVGKLDVDANAAVAKRLKVTSVPMLFVFKDGRPVWKHVGTMKKRDLVKKLEELIEAA